MGSGCYMTYCIDSDRNLNHESGVSAKCNHNCIDVCRKHQEYEQKLLHDLLGGGNQATVLAPPTTTTTLVLQQPPQHQLPQTQQMLQATPPQRGQGGQNAPDHIQIIGK